MKKELVVYPMILAGAIMMILFGYASYGFIASHPLFRWTIFVEPLIFTSILFFVGFLLVVFGINFKRKNRK